MLPVIDIPGLGHREIDPDTPVGRAMQLYSVQRTAPQRFWAKADIPWPRDGLGMVFLGSAVHLVGRALFGNQWTGEEPCVGPFDLPKYPFTVKVIAGRNNGSARLYASARDRRRAMTILGCRRNGAAFPSSDDSIIDMEDWELAQRVVEEVSEILRPVRQRWAAVINAIGDGILTGKLQVKLLPQGSSGFGAIRPATDWFVGSHASRFSLCQIDPSNPNSADLRGKASQWIFLTETSLNDHLNEIGLAFGAAPQVDAFHSPQPMSISTYLKHNGEPSRGKGAKPKPIWNEVNLYILSLCRENGSLGQDLPGWENQAAVERLVSIFLEKRGFPSSESTVRSRTAKALETAYQTIEAEKAENS